MKLLLPLIVFSVTFCLLLYRSLIRPELPFEGSGLLMADAAATILIAFFTWYLVQRLIFSVKRRFEQAAKARLDNGQNPDMGTDTDSSKPE